MATMYEDMPNEEYHATEWAISSSGLRLLAKSPRHFWAQYRAPMRPQRTQTAAQLLGSAVHCAVLEPGVFDARYVMVPEGIDRRTKDGKALFAQIEASGKTPLSFDVWHHVIDMAAAVAQSPEWQMIAAMGKAEHSIFWQDEETGVHCKIRPDLHIPPCLKHPAGLIVDVKTVGDASPEGFGAQCWRQDMLIQAAFYADGFRAQYGTTEDPVFMWLPIETEWPYCHALYDVRQPAAPVTAGDTEVMAAPDLLNYGRGVVRDLLQLYTDCTRTSIWPGYKHAPLVLPGYAMKTINAEQFGEVEISYE